MTQALGVARAAARTLALALAGGAALHAMPSAPPGVTEEGAPSFVVLGAEELGLSTAPTDLHLLPDGRVLVVSEQELAFGDGMRWEAFRENDGTEPAFRTIAVDEDGRIYGGTDGGIDRVEFTPDSRWRFTPAVDLTKFPATQKTTLVSVAAVAGRWFWYGGNGAIVSWRPGEQLRIVGQLGAVDRIFAVGSRVFVSDQSSGGLYRLTDAGTAEPVKSARTLVSDGVTCAVAFGRDEALVGTVSQGLRLFDGETLRPFGVPGLLRGGRRIADLCAVGDDYFAAAVDSVGVVFFDRAGRIVQVLDRTLDHRLARVQRVSYAANGVLWALLNEGVARVQFPSPLSHFEPLLAGGLVFAQPLRHAGNLWILADGRAMRGVYDEAGRLERLADETPAGGQFLFSLDEVGGRLFACNDNEIYVRESESWKAVLTGITNGRVVSASPAGDIYYVARGEIGVLRPKDGTYVAQRIAQPELRDSYGYREDAAGTGWLELGLNRVGRLDFSGPQPRLEICTAADGLAGGWTEVYVLDGVARFHSNNRLFRFDARRHRFIEDRELLAKVPQLLTATGRPTRDPAGRLWFTTDGAPHTLDENGRVETVAAGFAPTNYTIEDNRVVWMFERRRLVRYNPRIAAPPVPPPHVLITSVQLTAQGRRIFAPGAALAPLAYDDNSVVINFAAPANPFVAPVTFDVMLEGAGAQWVSTGTTGSVSFNRLKEGRYVFHVRPVVNDGEPGPEARLAFIVEPPWYRTTAAWAGYVVAGLGLVGFAIWFPSYLQQREKIRLGRLVAERTAELNASNDRLARQVAETMATSTALAASEERYRVLNGELEQRVEARTRELGREQARFKFIFDTAPVGLTWMRQKDVATRLVNPAYARISGVPVEQGRDPAHYRDTSDLEDRARRDELHAKLLRGEIDHYTLEKRFRHADGSVRWAVLAVRVFRDAAGEEQEIHTLFDITERKQAERELAEASGLLEAMLANMPDMVYFKDRDSRFVRFSAAFAKRFGLDPAMIRGRTDFDLFAREHAQEAFEDEQRIMRTGTPIIGKLERENYADGRVTWALTTKMPWRDGAGNIIGTFGISKDVTEWKEAEAKLEETHKQLLQTSRQAGMAEVATGVLHNVGNVLNSVNVSATLVADHFRHSKANNIGKLAEMFVQNKARLADFLTNDARGRMIPDYLATLAEMLAEENRKVGTELDNLRKNIEHIKDIVAMQQAYARTSGVIESVGVVDMVEDAIRINAGSLARHDVDVVRDYASRPVVTTDRHKVIQILINLVRNAKYACDESGRTAKRIALRTTSSDHKVRIMVEDNGVGIPPENLTRIFNHGFTTRKRGHGFGLHSGALAAKELGGTLTVHSGGPGCGATFTLELPYKPEAPDHGDAQA
ncbi:MAG TPA: PAS domain S-box protein [Opitutus sp.]|nr:PAS domain S-box protein [Opitutus sp.]